MPTIIRFLIGILSKVWKPVLGVFSGFFPWLWEILRKFFLRNIKDVGLYRKLFSSPIYAGALSTLITSVVGVFVSLFVILVQAFLKIREVLSSLFAGTGGGGGSVGGYDVSAVFSSLLKATGVLRAFSDTYSIWAPFLFFLLSLIGAIVYYKLVVKFIDKIFQVLGLNNQYSGKRL